MKNTRNLNWLVLSDEQMSNGWAFSLLNDEQMSNKVGVKHQPVNLSHGSFSSGTSGTSQDWTQGAVDC